MVMSTNASKKLNGRIAMMITDILTAPIVTTTSPVLRSNYPKFRTCYTLSVAAYYPMAPSSSPTKGIAIKSEWRSLSSMITTKSSRRQRSANSSAARTTTVSESSAHLDGTVILAVQAGFISLSE